MADSVTIPPSNLHAIELNAVIGCSDATVFPGDIIVGDSEGVIVVPAAMANTIAEDAWAHMGYEEFAAAEVARGRSIFGLYPATDASRAESERWRKMRG
jgi:regulator of RNase E activity RraA